MGWCTGSGLPYDDLLRLLPLTHKHIDGVYGYGTRTKAIQSGESMELVLKDLARKDAQYRKDGHRSVIFVTQEPQGITYNEKLKLLQTWEAVICGMESEEDKLRVTLQPSPDSPFMTLLHRLKSEYTNAVARLIGDNLDWLEWYWLENAMGAKALPAAHGGGCMQPIDGLSRLMELVEYVSNPRKQNPRKIELRPGAQAKVKPPTKNRRSR